MHESSLNRMKWFAENYLDSKKNRNILDVGSFDVNGTYKEIFKKSVFDYKGLDMEKGPNVDIVPENPYKWTEISDDTFDVVISGQALEHIEFFWLTIAEIVRVLKKDGLLCIIAPNGFDEHRYPVDCWRFFTDGMVALARYNQLEILHVHTNSAPSTKEHGWYSADCADSMLVARKPYQGSARPINLEGYKCIPENHRILRQTMKTYGEYLEECKGSTSSTENNVEAENKDFQATTKKHKIKIVIQNIWKKISRESKR